MENEVDVVSEEPVRNQDVVDDSVPVKVENEDSEVFEEAIEPPTLLMPSDSFAVVRDAVDDVSGSLIGGEELTGVEVVGSETFSDPKEVLVDERNLILQDMGVSSSDGDAIDGLVGGSHSLEIDESSGVLAEIVDSSVGDKGLEEKKDDSVENSIGVRSSELLENSDSVDGVVEGEVSSKRLVDLDTVAEKSSDESLASEVTAVISEEPKGFYLNEVKLEKDVFPTETNSLEAHTEEQQEVLGSSGDSSAFSNDQGIEAKEEVIVEECDDKELGDVDSNGLEVPDSEGVANDEPVELVQEVISGNGDTEVSDPNYGGISHDKMETEHQTESHRSLFTDSAVVNSPSPEQRIYEESNTHSVNGSINEELKTPSFSSSPEITEKAQEQSILMEDFGESSSTDGDDGASSHAHDPPPPQLNENVGGPSLTSRPAGLGSSAPLLEPSSRSVQHSRPNGSVSQRSSQQLEELQNEDAEENDETREKLQMIRVKFLRLARRLGQTPHNVVVAQVLYRLGLAEQLRKNTNRPGVFSFDKASIVAEQLEAAGHEPLDFSCTIMVIGKTGVGKSSTINSVLDDAKLPTNAFQQSTKKVQEIVGTVQGIKVKVIDTPGLFSSSSDQCYNEKILRSVKRYISKSPPDIVLYCDRLDMQSRDYGDVPLLRTITDIFGASIWFNAIVVLTHAASAPPDGPTGSPLSYEMFVTQRSHVVQQAIRQAAGDVRLMNPVSLVENHSACRMNRAGQRVLPNGQVWKPQLLLLSFASKILAEANMLLKLQDNPLGKPFGTRPRVPPLPFLLSSLLQSRPQLKLPEDQTGEDDNLDEALDGTSDSDEGSDYEELPPFKPLSKSQISKLSKAQRKAYFEELEYREKLFYKKQLKDEKLRRKFAKKMADAAKDLPDDHTNENLEDENNAPASVPVPMPDFVLPNSFDADNPSYRYRFLDSSSQWLVRPVLDSQGWDHDVGYEGLNVERVFVVKEKIPVSVSGQLTKDKKECAVQMELASSIKHGENKTSSLGLDMQTVGKDIAYTVRGESRFTNFRRNNTAAGISVTVLGDTVSAGLKVEDKLIVNKRFRVLMSGGAMTGRGDVAYGGRLEATLRDKDYPIGRFLSTIALSIVDWHGDLALGCNLQSQLPVGRGTNIILHSNLSNKGTGQVGVRMNSSEHLQLALVALVPVLKNVMRMILGSSQST